MRRLSPSNSSNVLQSWGETLASLLIVAVFVVVVFFMAQTALTGRDNGTAQQLHTLSQNELESPNVLKGEDTLKDPTEFVEVTKNLKQELALLARQFDDALNIRDKIEAELTLLRRLNAQTEKEAQDLRHKLEEAEIKRQNISGQLNDARQETHLTQKTLSLYKIEIDQLNRQIAHLSGDVETISPTSLQSLLAEIRTEYDHTFQSIQQFQSELVGVQEMQTNLQQEVADAKNKVETTLKTPDVSRKNIEHLQTNVSTLESKHQTFVTSLANLRRQQAAFKLKIEAMTALLLEAQSILKLPQRQVQEMQEAPTMPMHVEMKALQKDIEDIRGEATRLSQLFSNIEGDTAIQTASLSSLKDHLTTGLTTQIEMSADYYSEFFRRMSEALGDESDIRIVGDRFIFNSSVLFETGSIYISAAGRRELETFTVTLLNMTDKIPEDTDWVIRIDGHTDTQAIRQNSRFESNWELSIKRALAVLKTLSKYGVPENRMVASGFSEYAPISKGETPSDLARNRRIEIKLGQR